MEKTSDNSAQLPGAISLFGPSWEAFKLNCWTFVLGVVTPILLLTIPVLLTLLGLYSRAGDSNAPLSHHTVAAYNIFMIVVGVLGVLAILIFFYPFMFVLKLQSAKGVKQGFRKTLSQSRPFIWRVLGLYIVRGIIILVGLVLLIVPGLFMWRRYMLAPYYLIDKNLSIDEALKRSASETKPFSNAIWGMIGVYLVLIFLGIIPLIGGLIGSVASIVYCCAQGLRYLQIQKARA